MGAYGQIYLLTNTVNGKEYVGQTTQTLRERWMRHKWECTLKRPWRMAITAAVKKYGPECFKREVLCECDSQDELDEMEFFHIRQRNSLSPNGYNLNEGGNGKGRTSEETRRKISAANKGRVFTEEHRRKLSVTSKGRIFPDTEIRRRREFMRGKEPNALARRNSLLAVVKTYVLIDPKGNMITVTNMAEYCRRNGLLNNKMCELVRGKKTHYKGYSISSRVD